MYHIMHLRRWLIFSIAGLVLSSSARAEVSCYRIYLVISRCGSQLFIASNLLLLFSVQWLSNMAPRPGWTRGLSVHYGRPEGASGGADASGMNPNRGACHFGTLTKSSERYFTAVSDASSFGMICGSGGTPSCGGPACGRCIALSCVAKLRQNLWTSIFTEDLGARTVCVAGARKLAVVVKITDACPANHWNNIRKGAFNICGQRLRDTIDMSTYAFYKIVKSNPDPGQIHMEWRWAPCFKLGLWNLNYKGELTTKISS
eukprot:jgi/Mesvir1/22520/Mv18544-RA.1